MLLNTVGEQDEEMQISRVSYTQFGAFKFWVILTVEMKYL